MQWCHGTFRITSSHPSCGGGVGLGLDMARARARQHGHPTVAAALLRFLSTGEYPSQVRCAGAALSLSNLT